MAYFLVLRKLYTMTKRKLDDIVAIDENTFCI